MVTRRWLVTGLATAALLGGARDGLGQSSSEDGQRNADGAPQMLTVSVAVAGDRFLTLQIEVPDSGELVELAINPPTLQLNPSHLAAERISLSSVGGSEELFWESIADSEMPAAFEAYLEQWPDGDFASLATLKLEEIGAIAAGESSMPVSESAYEVNRAAPSVAEDLRALLGRELSASRVDENGWTDLHYAAVLDLPELVDRLLREERTVNARIKDDGSPLSSETKQVLGELGHDFEDWTRDGETALHVAAAVDARGAVVKLLEAGADVRARTHLGWTPLHYAAWANADEAIHALVELGVADVHERVVDGWTPLHLAAWVGNQEAVRALLGRGADVSARNSDGHTPVDLVKSNEVRRLLRGSN